MEELIVENSLNIEEPKPKQWFELSDVVLNTEKYNNFVELRNKKEKAKIINNEYNNYYWDYIYITAKLSFKGTLETPRGEVETSFDYVIKTNLERLKKNAEISIYEQTFSGLNEAVTIHFSSGSIISKIVFGDIEQAFIKLKEEVTKAISEYDEKVKEFNVEMDELKKQEENKDED